MPFVNSHDIAPMIFALALLMIPVVAILVKHQQKMAMILHGSQASETDHAEIASLKEEVSQLRQQVDRLTLAVDKTPQPLSESNQGEVRQRLGEPQL